jgi:hypothetical protein
MLSTFQISVVGILLYTFDDLFTDINKREGTWGHQKQLYTLKAVIIQYGFHPKKTFKQG